MFLSLSFKLLIDWQPWRESRLNAAKLNMRDAWYYARRDLSRVRV